MQNPDVTLKAPQESGDEDAASLTKIHKDPRGIRDEDVGSHKDPKVSKMKAQYWKKDLGRMIQRKWKDLREAFREIDLNKDHFIDEKEMVALFGKLQLDLRDAKALFRHMDKQGKGELSFAQFQHEFGKEVAGSYIPPKDPWYTVSSEFGALVDKKIYPKFDYDIASGGTRHAEKCHIPGQWRPPKGGKGNHNQNPFAALQRMEGWEGNLAAKYNSALKAFRDIDEDHNGALSREEIQVLFDKFNLPTVGLDDVFQKVETNEGNEISFLEFQRHFGKVINPIIGGHVTNFHHVNDFGDRFSPITNTYQERSNKMPKAPWMKKDDRVVHPETARGPRPVAPPRGTAPHPERALFREREKVLQRASGLANGRIPPNECTWAGPEAPKYHPGILEVDPEFTSKAKTLIPGAGKRKQTVMTYSKDQTYCCLENVIERKIQEGRFDMHMGLPITHAF